MKIKVLNTMHGLIPLFDEDGEAKHNLRLGEEYEVSIRLLRNIRFHKKYFKMLQLAWEYQNEAVVSHFKTFDAFRQSVQLAAGISDVVYNIHLKTYVEIPRSISFEKMDDAEFKEVYNAVRDVLFSTFLRHISVEEFEKQLINF